MDIVIKGNFSKIIRIIESLRKEDVAPPLVLWGLAEQIRKIIDSKPNVSSTKTIHRDILKNLTHIHQQTSDVLYKGEQDNAYSLLKQCARVDRIIKGRAVGDPWRELLQLSIQARQYV
jgi:DNA polymerase-3 subunit delta